MSRRVKGVLFADYVRMIRAAKDLPWQTRLAPQDLEWLSKQIDPHHWYPMDAYERMGQAIFEMVAGENLEAARQWGRRTIDALFQAEPILFAHRDPRETLMRFQVLRQALFDFPAAEVIAIRDGKAILEFRYGMAAKAEEAAVWQSLGFLERLLELAGARGIEARIESGTWKGDPATRVILTWRPAGSAPDLPSRGEPS